MSAPAGGFKKGDRVKLSQRGRRLKIRRDIEARGVVSSPPQDWHTHVLWDGLKRSQLTHNDYIELVVPRG
jgi:hypothetical protein